MTEDPGPARPPGHGGGDAAGQRLADGPLGRVLLDCSSRELSGTIHVNGEPGGSVHLDNGGIVAVRTPGAPSPEVLLLRSGQVPEPGWNAAFTAAASGGQMGAELVRRRLTGAVRLESVLWTGLADAMFALAAGQVDDCQVKAGELTCLLPLSPAAQARWLLAETARRLDVLARLRSQLTPDRDQVTSRTAPPGPRFRLDGGQRDILALANGRRTARDMAFVLGRGVFALTLELDRMHNAGLITVAGRRGQAAKRPATSLDGPLVRRAEAGAPGGPAGAGDGTPAELPRRQPTSRGGGTQPVRAPQNSGALQNASALMRMLRLGFSDPPAPGGASDHQAGR